MAETETGGAGQEDRPAKKPFGPGVLLLFGVVLVAVAAFCFKDVVYPATAAAEWRAEGNDWYIPLNWGAMIIAALAAVYSFILAALRSKRGAGGPAQAP